MEEDYLNTNLIGQGRKGTQIYASKVQQIQTQIQTLRTQNNLIQKQFDNQITDTDIKKQINYHIQFIQKQTNKLKTLLQKFVHQFKDPAAKNKSKQLWKMASKQISRNKLILQRIATEVPSDSFLKSSNAHKHSLIQNQQPYLNKDQLKTKNLKGQSKTTNLKGQNVHSNLNNHNNFQNRRSSLSRESLSSSYLYIDESQFVLEAKMIKEKKEFLQSLEKKNQKINSVMKQIANMVDEQGDNINLISQKVNQGAENLLQANEQLERGLDQQKKAKRRYCSLAIVFLLITIIVVGVVFIVTDFN